MDNGASKEFMESNSLVAKVAFLLLVIFVFIILLKTLTGIVSWLITPSGSPHLVDGMIDATQTSKTISVDPNDKNSKPINRSVNQDDGIEFTWSVWLYLNDVDYKPGQYKHVFHKGNDDFKMHGKIKGINFPNNAPGLYFAPNTNDMYVVMNTFGNIIEKVKVENVPLNKWYNVIIRLENRDLDIYINGTIVNKHILRSVPKQNYDDVYVAMNGGFNGYISDLWYFNYALGTSKIQSLVERQPNMNLQTDSMMDGVPKYFSLRWYFRNTNTVGSGYGGL